MGPTGSRTASLSTTAATSARRRGRRVGVLIAILATLLGPAILLAPSQPATAAARANIVLITADDMSKTDLRWMPQIRRLLRHAGVRLDGFISNHPLCCPARAEILTGQYAQNNGVLSNKGPFGGYQALLKPNNHVGSWLKSSGYKTAFVGKHMNGWEATAEHQRGWTVFDPIMRRIYQPTGLTMFNNGTPRRFPDVYNADLLGRRTATYVRRFSASGAPFFIWTSQVVPHRMPTDGVWLPPVPAARHRTLYPNAVPPALSHPAFNEDDVSDKPPWVQNSSKVSEQDQIDSHRARIRSLRSVDDQVKATVDALRAAHELRNTYLFFTSDNGYLLGEHRLTGKNKPYEQALRVPLLARGPGLPAGTTRTATYGLVDLAPTFARIGGVTPARKVDGRSMLATLRRDAPGYSHYLGQATGGGTASTGNWWWRGVRSASYVYIRYEDGFQELYDMANDPAQLNSVANDPAYAQVRDEYAARLTVLQDCAGRTCLTGGTPSP